MSSLSETIDLTGGLKTMAGKTSMYALLVCLKKFSMLWELLSRVLTHSLENRVINGYLVVKVPSVWTIYFCEEIGIIFTKLFVAYKRSGCFAMHINSPRYASIRLIIWWNDNVWNTDKTCNHESTDRPSAFSRRDDPMTEQSVQYRGPRGFFKEVLMWTQIFQVTAGQRENTHQQDRSWQQET